MCVGPDSSRGCRRLPHMLAGGRRRGDAHRDRRITSSRSLVTFAAIGGDHLRRDQHIDAPAAEPLLADLLQRWLRELQLATVRATATDHHLWKAFARLSESPVLLRTPNAVDTLERATHLRLKARERRSILELLVEAPNAYTRFEAMLLHASVNEHFWTDEVDLLDDVCDRLFGRSTGASPA
jgi:hypothetical protein